jgi:hypothetical protein
MFDRKIIFFDGGVKVIGTPIGSRPDPSKPMIDGDNDGKCQEEGGKWVPCPPGVAAGTVVNATESLMKAVKQRRRKASSKAKKIRDEHKLPESAIKWLKRNNIGRFLKDMDDPNLEENDRLEIAASWLGEIFLGEFKDRNGNIYQSEIYRITPDILDDGSYDFSSIEIEGIITDENGEAVGDYVRVLNLRQKIVEHSSFHLNNQGTGLGSAFIASTESAYKAAGFEKIETLGASASDTGDGSWVGATHWPRNGFDWQDMYSQNTFFEYITRAINAYENEDRKELFENQQQVEELKKLMELSKKERPGSPSQTLFAGDFLFWPGATKWFQEREAMVNYAKRI